MRSTQAVATSLRLEDATSVDLQSAARFFDEHGYIPLSGVPAAVVGCFEETLAAAIGITREEFQPLLDPRPDAAVFPRVVRQRLSRLASPPALVDTLFSYLTPIMTRLIGPIVHASSTFHGQFKGGGVSEVEHYHNEGAAEYMEVHGPYRLHQDFTGASLPTSPSGLTLWVPLNTCAESTLRLYPGSHRLGMFCHKMWPLDDPRLVALGRPLDIEARVGTAVLFNALLFHGTSNPGLLRRVSCDIRFFPLCGFLPSQPYMLDPHPGRLLDELEEAACGDTLLAPILEQRAYLGEAVRTESRRPLSPLNWVNYIVELLHGRAEAGLVHLMRFVNGDLLEGSASILARKFHDRALEIDRLNDVRRLVAASGAS